jgi:nitroreductase
MFRPQAPAPQARPLPSRRRTMTIMDAIYAHRPVSAFTSASVSGATIHALLYAAMQVPFESQGGNPGFIVMQNRNDLQALSDWTGRLFNAVEEEDISVTDTPNTSVTRSPAELNMFHNADTIIAVCCSKTASHGPSQAWLATENILLAAVGMGLGTCLIGEAVAGLETVPWRKRVSLPDQSMVVSVIALGIDGGGYEPIRRQPPDVISWLT